MQNVRWKKFGKNYDWLRLLDHEDGKATERQHKGLVPGCRCCRKAPSMVLNAAAKICLCCEGVVLP